MIRRRRGIRGRRVRVLLLVCELIVSAFFSCLLADPAPSPSPETSPSATPEPLQPVALDAFLSSQNVWQMSAHDFTEANHGAGFHWISDARDAVETTRPSLTLFKIPVCDAVANFTGDKLSGVTILFYNRGDAGALDKEKFDSLVQQCVNVITAFANVKFTQPGRDPANAVKAYRLVWQNAAVRLLLEYSFTKTPEIPFRAEFVRLTITPPEKPKSLIEQSLAESRPAGKFSGIAHVKHESNGDVWIDGVPMVDQGEKGYCVVASAERVMRYYGANVDQNELAELANTSAARGTNPTVMVDSLEKLANRLRVKVRTLLPFDPMQFEKMFTEYNRVAKQQHEDVISEDAPSLSAIFKQMKPETLRTVRTKNPADMNRFFRLVQSHVEEGVPPLWSLMVGIIREPKDPDGFGGHMRLIIGYNAQTQEIIYTDSWGYGHEKKRMPLADAWTMTLGLYAIEPL
jgi:Peptidase_C39 like family